MNFDRIMGFVWGALFGLNMVAYADKRELFFLVMGSLALAANFTAMFVDKNKKNVSNTTRMNRPEL